MERCCWLLSDNEIVFKWSSFSISVVRSRNAATVQKSVICLMSSAKVSSFWSLRHEHIISFMKVISADNHWIILPTAASCVKQYYYPTKSQYVWAVNPINPQNVSSEWWGDVFQSLNTCMWSSMYPKETTPVTLWQLSPGLAGALTIRIQFIVMIWNCYVILDGRFHSTSSDEWW